MTHKQVLTDFLNDSPDSLVGQYKGSTIYLWHKIAYQVVLYKNIKKTGSKEDHFIKQGNYGIREVSPELLSKMKLGLDKISTV